MKKIIAVGLTAAMALMATGSVFAQQTAAPAPAKEKAVVVKTSAKDKATTATKKKEAVKELGNTLCPISKHPVGSMQKGSGLTYKGYKVGLCCDGCSKKFNSDPEAYFKIAQESVKK